MEHQNLFENLPCDPLIVFDVNNLVSRLLYQKGIHHLYMPVYRISGNRLVRGILFLRVGQEVKSYDMSFDGLGVATKVFS